MNDEVKLPELQALLGKLNGLSDTRNKLITQIEDLIDRIRNNRTSTEAIKGTEPDESIIGRLSFKLQEMDLSNERLDVIVRRLSELV